MQCSGGYILAPPEDQPDTPLARLVPSSRQEKESAGGTALEAAREALSRALLALEVGARGFTTVVVQGAWPLASPHTVQAEDGRRPNLPNPSSTTQSHRTSS